MPSSVFHRRFLKQIMSWLGGTVVALLLTFFAAHIGDCHVSMDTHQIASCTRRVDFSFGVPAEDKDRPNVGVADGGAKQHVQVTLAQLLAQPLISVVRDGRPAAMQIVVGKNTSLAHRKLTSLLI